MPDDASDDHDVLARHVHLFGVFLRAHERQEKVEEMAEIRRLYAQILEAGDCLSLRDLAVSGDDLIAAGMQPGKELGRVLQDMLRDVVDVPAHNDRDYLLQRYLPS